jgi:hypothetical protein
MAIVFASISIIVLALVTAFIVKKQRSNSLRIMNISDYVTPNPILPTYAPVSRFSLTNKTRKEFEPLQTIA